MGLSVSPNLTIFHDLAEVDECVRANPGGSADIVDGVWVLVTGNVITAAADDTYNRLLRDVAGDENEIRDNLESTSKYRAQHKFQPVEGPEVSLADRSRRCAGCSA